MANDNNKINDLVSETDDDPTSQLESLQLPGNNRDIPCDDTDDDDTFDFERLEETQEFSDSTIDALKSDIRSRNESIGRLQFDIEQLRSRWSGLEKEISAREDLSERLNEQLEATQEKLARTEQLLSDRETLVDSLQSDIGEKNELLASVEKEALNISEAVDAGKTVIGELQERVAEQRATIKDLQREETSELSAREAEIAERLAEIESLRKKLEKSEQRRKTADLEVTRLATELDRSAAEVEAATAENLQLKTTLEEDYSSEQRQLQASLAAQEGSLAGAQNEVRVLTRQLTRTEQYADTLRAQLGNRSDEDQEIRQQLGQLTESLEDAHVAVAGLQQELKEERATTAIQLDQLDKIEAQHEDEIRKIRFELGNANQTLADQESVNEQLESDLDDNQGFREELENQLKSSEKSKEKVLSKMQRALDKAEKSNNELQDKLESKENAVAALLAELASRSRTIESIGEMENVIHEIDGRMSNRIDDQVPHEKDRTARLLIGNVEGQELQFPLFKDRLTIGRTEHNDIQLKAQFISRRHALIVTENSQTRIVDWGSKNGVYVNDTRVSDQLLKNGDILAIGAAEFRYEERQKR